jgi:hypothetical protein
LTNEDFFFLNKHEIEIRCSRERDVWGMEKGLLDEKIRNLREKDGVKLRSQKLVKINEKL